MSEAHAYVHHRRNDLPKVGPTHVFRWCPRSSFCRHRKFGDSNSGLEKGTKLSILGGRSVALAS